MLDREFYDALSEFVDKKIESIPTSHEAAIEALEIKANVLRKDVINGQAR